MPAWGDVPLRGQKGSFILELEAFRAKIESPGSSEACFGAVITAALDQYLASEQWQVERIKEGLRQADGGALVDHGEIATWVASWAGTHERPMPEIR